MRTATCTSLPNEVQEMVGPFLSQQLLTVCLRVCQAWKQMFHPYLWRDVEINWNDHMNWEEHIVDALRTNSHLIQSLRLKADKPEDHLRRFLRCGLPTFPRLTSAELEGPFSHDTDRHFAAFIHLTSSSGWKRLVFRNPESPDTLFDLSIDSFEALLKHAETLEIFRMEAMSFLKSKLIDKLLCSATRLKELYVFNSEDRSAGHWLDAPNIAQSQWVCSDLEVFACRIENISRPDITRTIVGLDPKEITMSIGTPQEGIELQLQVYAKLARFTKLRNLFWAFLWTPMDRVPEGGQGILPSV